MLYARETYVNATEGHMIGESDVEPTYCETRGEVYRQAQREYGRCIGRMYVDTPDGPRAIGWVFQGRDHYSDTGESYIREVWVAVHTAPDTVTRTPHYA